MQEEKALITAVKNPFDPGARVVLPVAHRIGLTVRECLELSVSQTLRDVRYSVAVNGNPIGYLDEVAARLVQPGDHLVFCPVIEGGGGSNILRTLAMIAVSVVAFAIAGPAVAGWLGFVKGTTAFSIASGFGAAGGMLAGGMLVNAILPPQLSGISASDINKESPTYSWSLLDNPDREGGALPALYGTVRATPPRISKNLFSLEYDQNLRLLYGLTDHQIDSCTDIEVNGNPIENYPDVVTHFRAGTVDQEIVPGFETERTDTSVNQQLSTSWITQATVGEIVSGYGVVIFFPAGLYKMNEHGNIQEWSVQIRVEGRVFGASEWNLLSDVIHQKADKRPFRLVLGHDADVWGPASAKLEFRVKRVDEPSVDPQVMDICTWEYLEEASGFGHTYPGTALFGIDALATKALNGQMPRVTCLLTRSVVSVWTGAEWADKPATSPAWASWDMWVAYNYGGQVKPERMIYQEFSDWADYCTAQGFTCNLYVDSTMGMPQALAQASIMGRGHIVQRGTMFGVVVDRPTPRSQVIGVGDIFPGSFEETWIGSKDLINVVEVAYVVNGERKTVEVPADDYDTTDEEIKKSSLFLPACNDRQLAIRHGRFAINCNKHLKRIIRCDVGIKALASQVGDVAGISHDRPQWGYSGLIYSAGASHAYLDRAVTFTYGESYSLLVRHQDDDSLETVALANPATPGNPVTTQLCNLTEAWSKIPAPDASYAFGNTGMEVQDFRITSITRSMHDGYRKITALQYYEPVYSDAVVIADPPVISDLVPVRDLVATEVWRMEDGRPISFVSLTWRGVAIQWSVFMRKASGPWVLIGSTASPWYDAYGLELGATYTFAVVHDGNPDNSTPSINQDVVTFDGVPGGDDQSVVNTPVLDARLIYSLQGSMAHLCEMQWSYSLPVGNFDGFAILWRYQPSWWQWSLSGPYLAANTGQPPHNTLSGGGLGARVNLGNAMVAWKAAGIPYCFFMISDDVAYEVIRVDLAATDLGGVWVVERGMEGTAPRDWAADAQLCYACSEYTDTVLLIDDPSRRHITFPAPVPVAQALHATIVAAKRVPVSPGYVRSPLSFWSAIQAQ